MKRFEVEGQESGEVKSFDTLAQARRFVKDAQRFDRENGIDGEVWTITDNKVALIVEVIKA